MSTAAVRLFTVLQMIDRKLQLCTLVNEPSRHTSMMRAGSARVLTEAIRAVTALGTCARRCGGRTHGRMHPLTAAVLVVLTRRRASGTYGVVSWRWGWLRRRLLCGNQQRNKEKERG